MSSNLPDLMTVCTLAVLAMLLLWLSLSMAVMESALSRVTRSSVNNTLLELESSEDVSKFAKVKQTGRIRKVRVLTKYRAAAAGACSFYRVSCNVLVGVCVAALVAWCARRFAMLAMTWLQAGVGLACALICAGIAVAVHARAAAVSVSAIEIVLAHKLSLKLVHMLVTLVHARSQSSPASQVSQHGHESTLEKIQSEQRKALVDRLSEHHDFDPEISEMMRNVLRLNETLVREIMVPRTDMIAINKHTLLGEFLQICSRSGFSRVPVVGEDVDDLAGVAYLKDAVRATAFNLEARDRAVETICREPMLVPESKPVDDLFHDMQRLRQHVAIVVDEYGGIAGLVTIEDAIEQIVGELQDEHDHAQHAEPVRVRDHVWLMPARAAIAQLEEIFEVSIDEDDVDTLYGLLTKLLGTVPMVGSSATTRGLRLSALDSAGRRKKVSTIVVQPEQDHTPLEQIAQEAQALKEGKEHKDSKDTQGTHDTAAKASKNSQERLVQFKETACNNEMI